MDLPFLGWTDAFAVGHDSLDAEHHCLIDAINAIHAAENANLTFEQINRLLDALMRLAETHQQHESSVLRKINSGPLPSAVDRLAFLNAMVDAAIEEHLLNHLKSQSQLDEIIRKFRPALDLAGNTLSQKLRSWFIDHAVKFDARLNAVFHALPDLGA